MNLQAKITDFQNRLVYIAKTKRNATLDLQAKIVALQNDRDLYWKTNPQRRRRKILRKNTKKRGGSAILEKSVTKSMKSVRGGGQNLDFVRNVI